jgi:NitT/TauT family transport system permease protein
MTEPGIAIKSLRALSKLGPFLICLALWQLITMLGITDPAFLPGLGAIGSALADLVTERVLWVDLGTSLSTAGLGLLFGSLIGVPLGTAMALSKAADGFFGPIVKATYSLPKSALVPLFVLWFGVGGITNILSTILTTLLPIVIYTYHGVHGVPRLFIWSAQAFGTPRWRMVGRIVLPAALPSIVTGVRIALGLAFIVTIAAEMIVSNYGIGKLMFFFGDSGAYNYMFAAVILIVIAAYIADRCLVLATDHILRWQEPVARHA